MAGVDEMSCDIRAVVHPHLTKRGSLDTTITRDMMSYVTRQTTTTTNPQFPLWEKCRQKLGKIIIRNYICSLVRPLRLAPRRTTGRARQMIWKVVTTTEHVATICVSRLKSSRQNETAYSVHTRQDQAGPISLSLGVTGGCSST